MTADLDRDNALMHLDAAGHAIRDARDALLPDIGQHRQDTLGARKAIDEARLVLLQAHAAVVAIERGGKS